MDTERIRALNDQFRTAPTAFGKLTVTASVNAKGPEFVASAIAETAAFNDFSEDNDPHGEHDFGSFELGGEKLFWKIDYYDARLEYGSEDPADPKVTTRVLTIMLASDY